MIVDDYQKITQELAALRAEVRKLEKKEKDLKNSIIAHCLKENIITLTGAELFAEIHGVEKPKMNDPVSFATNVLALGDTELYENRLRKSRVLWYWDQKIEVPGVVKDKGYTIFVGEL
jgi:hypothetical protein